PGAERAAQPGGAELERAGEPLGELLLGRRVTGVAGGEQRAQLVGGGGIGVLGEPGLGQLAVRSDLRHRSQPTTRARYEPLAACFFFIFAIRPSKPSFSMILLNWV